MRGKVDIDRKLTDAERITPAYAGKSVLETRHDFTEKGSPPPMRGKAPAIVLQSTSSGITPRLCGEKLHPHFRQYFQSGSPPPMRGKASSSRIASRSAGITPAYAGKSVRTLRNSHHDQDHPRLCGEKRSFFALWHLMMGSPPPMRGKVKKCDDLSDVRGITPAYAGKRFSLFICKFFV